jgi:non-ribosomal peptide synthase protein (TIGR01720 family)
VVRAGEVLAALAVSPEVVGEAGWWQEVSAGVVPLPVDHPDGTNTYGTIENVLVALERDETERLLRSVSGQARAGVEELLLASLLPTITGWTGAPHAHFTVERHGRDLPSEVDLSRTMGFFTAAFPVRFDLPKTSRVADVLRTVKDTMRAVPGRGVDYGLLRWLGPPDVRAALAATPPPAIAFNYLGQHHETHEPDGFHLVNEPVGPSIGPDVPRLELLTVTPHIVGGVLQVAWTYSPHVHDRATIDRLARDHLDRIRALLDHAWSDDEVLSPSDFPLAGLDDDALAAVTATLHARSNPGPQEES